MTENARINRRCGVLLDQLKASGSCSGDLPVRAFNACSHVRYGSKLERHATRVLRQACPTRGFDGPRRRRRRRR